MKKNTLFKRVALVLALVLVIALGVGCTPATTPQPTGTNPQPTGTDAPPVSEPDREPGVYFVTVLPSANGTVVADRTEAREGDTITLTVTPDEGYELISLMVNGEESQLTFQMPAEDVSILARFGLPEEKEENKNDGGNVKVYPNGTFFGSAGNYHCSDVLNMKTDKGDNPYLVMDAQKATPLYAYVKGFTGKQFHLEMTVEVTAIRADEGYPKFGLMINDGKEMVKFYLDMNTDFQVGGIGAVHQKSGKQDDWAGQTTWALNKKLDLNKQTVKLSLLRDGTTYYFYVDGRLVATGNDLSGRNAATGIFTFGTSLKVTKYTLVKSGDGLNTLLAEAKKDAAAFNGAAMTENFFTQSSAGVYTLTTDSDAQHKVDDVTFAGKVMHEKYYSLKGKLSLTNAGDWGQARILISADANNEYFIALEKTNSGKFQLFTMSKANEEGWNDWRLIAHAELNGTRNSIDFEVIVNGSKLYFLIDNEIYYSSNRVSMTESTVKFTGFNVGTTTVENLEHQVFADSAAVEAYLAGKEEKAYASQFQGRMDDLYKEYITDNGCAGKGGTLILGDSNMDFWGSWETQTGLTKYVNGYNVGIGGSTTKDWIHAYDKLIKPFEADRFVILVGGNDVNVWGSSGEETVANLKTLLEMIHADHPDAEIYYIYTTPSPSAYADGDYSSAKLRALVSGAKTLCESLDYVQGMDVRKAMTTADEQNSKEELFADDKVHMNDAGYKVFSDILYEEIFRGENFGAAEGYKTSNGIELSKDKGENASIEIFGLAPRYAYLNKVFTDKFSFEAQFNVSAVLNGDSYPKFGLLVNGASEMVKFFVDMTAEKTAGKVGVVYQPTGGGDDWGGSVSADAPGMSFTGSDTVKLKLVRDGKAYYFYVNDRLVLHNKNGFKEEKGAVGIFSFNAALVASNYAVSVDSDADATIEQAKSDLAFLSKVGLTTNFFKEEPENIYTLTTDSDAGHKVDDLRLGYTVVRAANYSVKGKLTLTNAGDWGQARILVSADAKNEYVFALEKTNAGKFQLFTMSKADQEGWDKWELIFHQDYNADRNSLNFEVVVIGNKLHLLVDDSVIYVADKVAMTESTVKFTGLNTATTTVENLALEIFDDANAANTYLDGKDSRVGETFGAADGQYHTTAGISLKNDKGENPTVTVTGGVPQYAYVNKVLTQKFSLEMQFNVSQVLNDDKYPKFGLLVNGASEMVKFFVDMTPEKTATRVGVVYQPTGGGDDWGGSTSVEVPGMSFTGSDTVKLKLIRDGKAYYLYANDNLAFYNESGIKDEKGAIGFFSFNAALTASNYTVRVDGNADADIQKAKGDVSFLSKVGLTNDFFKENTQDVYTLTTNSGEDHKVDYVKLGHNVVKGANYSIKGKLSLTDANDWGQARIQIFADSQNQYFIALEKANSGKYQIFTMSKANEDGWNDWRLIEHAEVNGTRNSIDFEVIVNGSKVYFLIDNAICYTMNRVSMTESSLGFTGYNTSTTTVENLALQIFDDNAAVEAYLAEKQEKAYVSQFQGRMDDLYKEYITDNGCAGKGGTLILGDSNMDFWTTWDTQAGLTKYVNGYNVGIGGSTTEDWIHAYDKLIKPFEADRFVILVGGNDVNVWGSSGEETVANLKTLLEMIHADHPDAEIYYIYTTPSPSAYADGDYSSAKLRALVSGAKTLCESLDYVQGVDVSKALTTVDGKNSNTGLFAEDKVHMNAGGYQAFAGVLYEEIFRGENFGAAEGYKTSSGVELLKDKGDNATIKVFGGVPQYAYLHDVFTDKFSVEMQFNVSAVLNGDSYPKFGLQIFGASEMVKFFVDMTPAMTASKVGVVYQPTGSGDDWGGSVAVDVSGMSFTGNDTVKMKLVRNGCAYFLYVNDVLVLKDATGFKAEKGAVGIFSFNTEVTASAYKVLLGDDANADIAEAVKSLNFFDNADVDLTKDYGANVGTVSANTGKTEFLHVKNFSATDFYFEAKFHVNAVYNNDGYPKFGILAEDGTTRENFFVDMTPGKTADTVGRMTATNDGSGWADNWGDLSTAKVAMKFAGEGEYVTLGLKKEGNRFLLYVNGEFVLYRDSAITGNATLCVFGFNTGMDLKEYFVNKVEGIDSLLTLQTEGEIGTVELGGTIWTDKTYTFYEMPQAFIGESYIQNTMESEISFTAKKDGYIYVLTPYRGHDNSIADELEIDLYDRIETPAWYLANYTSEVEYWAYERNFKAGQTVAIPGNSNWHMVVISELPIDPTVHKMGQVVFSNDQLAVLAPVDGTVATVERGGLVFSDRSEAKAKFATTLPYCYLGRDFIFRDYDDANQAVSATVTKSGVVLALASNNDARKDHMVNTLGFTYVEDLSSYGDIIVGGTFSEKGYGLYIKKVSQGEQINWEETYIYNNKSYTMWLIPFFQSATTLPAEPPVSIAITQMPTKTTYKLGESFDPTGMVVIGTDKYGNVAQLDTNQYVTVPSTFTANAYAASVIVEDMIVAVPVIITDANGNPMVDDTVVDTTKYTTQKAPLLNGSVKRSTPDDVIAAIAKMEADGATAFNVHLTSLDTQYRNYESFKKIADCTDYPVMAIAYGDESNREYRIELMKEAVRAGFAIVDIPMDTFDADSRATLKGTVFENANPAEVSMNADVIAQQKALVQEFKDLGAEVLMSAHIGVSLTEAEGVALAKEMESRGADVAKIVLGSSANKMQDVVMQTNQTLQNELNIKFYYNASGNASKPYRTASAMIGTYMVFCYAEYHETNLSTYDYITDLKAFYSTVPALKPVEPMIKTNNGQKLDTVALGKTIWTTRDYVFTSMPEAFIGKTFVKASYGVKGETVDITVQKPGYIYVLTNAYKTDNSQAETLDEMNYTKLDLAGWKFCDFSGNSSYIWVYEKYVEPGETLQLGQWSVVIASEEKLNLDADCFKTADSDMAILQPAEGASVGNMEAGTLAFADRTHTISGMPYWLAGKNYIVGNYGAGSATVTRGGVVYMITNTGTTMVDGVSMTRASILEADGFVKVEVPAFTAISDSGFASYDFLLFKKTVSENDTVTWPSWAIPVFSGDLVLSENLAKIAPDGTTTKAAQYDQNVRLFDNRTYYASGDKLSAFHGKSYLYAGFEEGATGMVTAAGTVYVQIPVKTGNSKYEQLEADLIAAGYTPVAYRLYRNNKGLPGKSLGYAQKLYQKEVAVGDVIHYGQYNLVYFDTLAAEEYYEMPSVTTAANIYNNPEINGIQNSLYTYTPASRNWQGCPVVTITAGPNGNRMWAAWFTGGETELATGNFAVLLYSDDNGTTWVDPAVAIIHPDTAAQVTKPQLWTLEDGRLWVSWSQHTGTGGFDGMMGTWAAICENPGAPMDELRWSEPQRLFDGRGNGKITVLNQGKANEEWLTTAFDWIDRNYSDVYSSTDKGATWTWKGRAEVTGSTYNNAILVERQDGSLWMLLRQLEGNMKESFSYDGGKTWTNATVSNIAHPNSAIYVGWTSSGKLLMINHKDFSGRNNLTAFLSEDGGKTWPYTLLLDGRTGVSYPDVIEDNGTFYVVYDYDRFNTGRMYMAKITEADIKAGQLVSDGSYLKHQFASMGITGAQVGENVQKIDLTDKEMSASTTSSPAKDAFDGNTDTRWCATSDATPQWLMIDLKDVYDLEAVYIFFEQKSDWNYKIETSVDGDVWDVYSNPDAQALVDVTVNQQAQARYIRLTVESTTGGAWASVWEMEVYVNKDTPKP